MAYTKMFNTLCKYFVALIDALIYILHHTYAWSLKYYYGCYKCFLSSNNTTERMSPANELLRTVGADCEHSCSHTQEWALSACQRKCPGPSGHGLEKCPVVAKVMLLQMSHSSHVAEQPSTNYHDVSPIVYEAIYRNSLPLYSDLSNQLLIRWGLQKFHRVNPVCWGSGGSGRQLGLHLLHARGLSRVCSLASTPAVMCQVTMQPQSIPFFTCRWSHLSNVFSYTFTLTCLVLGLRWSRSWHVTHTILLTLLQPPFITPCSDTELLIWQSPDMADPCMMARHKPSAAAHAAAEGLCLPVIII